MSDVDPPEPELPEELKEQLRALYQTPGDDRQARIESLIAAHPTFAEPMRRRVARADASMRDLQPDPIPTRIGPYRIESLLGEGGMGAVFRARQEHPVRRTVALKVVKLGMDSRQILGRFELERQALALMDHPSIATIYDAGTTPQGQPYFAMEFVAGLTLTVYCRQHALDLDARIRIFQQVCQAVQHAHQKGVLHRDLKPGNVLVTAHAGVPAVKVIDFGLARSTQQDLTDAPFRTVHDQLIGTPEYMSPEQAGGRADGIDTRTDIYSLGVVLYELLTGHLPLDSHRLRNDGPDAMRAMIREEEPGKPSTRVASPRDRKALSGDLDWIIMRAMAKDPALRYSSAAAFSQDLDRYSSCEPVDAGPPSTRYVIAKFARRYRTHVIAAALLLVSLIVGITGTVWFMLDARAQARTAKLYRLIAISGEIEEARAQANTLHPSWPDRIPALRKWLAVRGRKLAAARVDVERSIKELQQRSERDGTDTENSADQVALEVLARIQRELGTFTGPAGTLQRVRDELGWAQRIEDLTVRHPAAAHTWEEARQAIARADGISAHESYGTAEIELTHQMGLVPLGMNPATHLWEFYHLGSASDPAALPSHAADGSISMGPGTGIVFVLLPGGEFNMGEQRAAKTAANYDPRADPRTGVHRVRIEPFFLGRYEVTQGQWERLTYGGRPSQYGVGQAVPPGGVPVDQRHPVESVTWDECSQTLANSGLMLPTQAQWEYGCRAGTDTPWYCGNSPADLEGHANVLDRTAARVAKVWQGEHAPFDDGYTIHSPVGSFAANHFGLHDVHGNVWEWCRDTAHNSSTRIHRGGCFMEYVYSARSGAQNNSIHTMRVHTLGVRAARSLRRR